MNEPVIYVIACGGPPAADLQPFVAGLQADGWDVCVVATPSALKFLDADALASLTGHPVRYDFKHPDEPDVLPAPQAMVVAPATFNTINKWAAGISDTLALGLLNEALGLDIPIVAVPRPNAALARHRAFEASVQFLRDSGVQLLYDPKAFPLPVPYRAPSTDGRFPWTELTEATSNLYPPKLPFRSVRDVTRTDSPS
jgi:phosphopantothenoylcysteine synthetase/decarboxylase